MSGRPRLSDNEIRLFKLKYEVIKKKLPRFIRQESWRYVRVKDSWRRPRGKDSKMRLHKKGRPPLVRIGYRTPKLVRGLHPTGFEEILVYNVKDVETKVTDPERQAIRIAGSVGRRKRVMIIKYADEHGIRVLNRRL